MPDMRQPSTPAKSGRLLLRMPPELHEALDGTARAAGLSLNEFCVRRLAATDWRRGFSAGIVMRAAALLREDLRAVVLHGSQASGEATPGSDVDALVVVHGSVPLGRRLYRDWDAGQASASSEPRVDPHFVHVPEEDNLSGLWAEVAIAGEVLFDRDGRTTAHLVRARQAIADGIVRRRVVHGQPYWTGVS
jgi:predicted nucleotidyltransferase